LNSNLLLTPSSQPFPPYLGGPKLGVSIPYSTVIKCYKVIATTAVVFPHFCLFLGLLWRRIICRKVRVFLLLANVLLAKVLVFVLYSCS